MLPDKRIGIIVIVFALFTCVWYSEKAAKLAVGYQERFSIPVTKVYSSAPCNLIAGTYDIEAVIERAAFRESESTTKHSSLQPCRSVMECDVCVEIVGIEDSPQVTWVESGDTVSYSKATTAPHIGRAKVHQSGTYRIAIRTNGDCKDFFKNVESVGVSLSIAENKASLFKVAFAQLTIAGASLICLVLFLYLALRKPEVK